MSIKSSCFCKNSSVSNHVLTLLVDQGDDRRHAGTLIGGIFKSFMQCGIPGQQICYLKLHIQNMCIREDHPVIDTKMSY